MQELVAQIARNVKNRRDLTVITNAVNVALESANCREITNCLLGFPSEKFLSETHAVSLERNLRFCSNVR